MLDFNRYVAFTHCRALLPWFPHARRTEASDRLRRLVAERDCPVAAPDWRYRIVAAGLFLVSGTRQIRIAMRRDAARFAREHGVGRLTQLVDLLYWTFGLNQFPGAYYLQRIVVRRDRRAWRHYIDHREHGGFLNHFSGAWDTRLCRDKKFLFTQLHPAGVPVIGVLLAAENGVLDRTIAGGPVPAAALAHDLIMKPSDGQMDEGIEYWHHEPATGGYRYFDHMKNQTSTADLYRREVSWAELERHFADLSVARPMLLQRWLKSHPDLAPINPHNIANFRLVTSRLAGRVEVISALLRLGFDRTRWPNTTYQANVDLATGVLDWATSRDAAFGYTECHIESGARVKGLRVDGFAAMKAMVCDAHARFSTVPNIGWDVVHTADGILIMEANLYWGADISQVAGPLLGETGYAAALLAVVPSPVAGAAD